MRAFLSTLLLALLTASTGYPWGAQGHAAIGLVAERRLTPGTRRQIQLILGNDDLAGIASWMDELRGVANDFGPLAGNAEARQLAARFPHTDPWHYVDLPLGEAGYTDHDPFSRPDDVVHQINLAIAVLEGRSAVVTPRIAIYMIVHFVGDLHQPMHVGSGYYDLANPAHPILVTDPVAAVGKPDDKGGNALSYGSQRFEELHTYWDSLLPGKVAGDLQPATLAQKLEAALQPQAWASPGDHHRWAEAWATESLIAARQVYAGLTFGPAEQANGGLRRIPITLPASYEATSVILARERLAKAGFHLAELLNAIDWPVARPTREGNQR